MTHEELTKNAREHIRALDKRNTFGAPSAPYDQARFVEATLIYFGSRTRSDYVQAKLNSETGKPISVLYHSQNHAGKS